MAADDDEFELVAASLRADASDLAAFVEALAVKLEQALPWYTRVHRRSGPPFSPNRSRGVTTGPAPQITSTTPGSGATGVGRNRNVTATFSEAITGFSTATVRITRVSNGAVVQSTVGVSSGSRVLTLNPTTSLAARTQYRVTITGGTTAVRDLAGNPLTTRTWTFTTGTGL